ncbi:hypothetical protein GCM10009608_62980 [Pseudonocardia alaniniphila]
MRSQGPNRQIRHDFHAHVDIREEATEVWAAQHLRGDGTGRDGGGTAERTREIHAVLDGTGSPAVP